MGIHYNSQTISRVCEFEAARQFITAITAARRVLADKDVYDPDSRLFHGMTDNAGHRPRVIPHTALERFFDILQLGVAAASSHPTSSVPLQFEESPDGDFAEAFLNRFCAGKSALCITTTGEVVIAPQTAQAGDIITIFPGGSEVYTLRPIEDDRYRMVGLAYAYGYMSGEELTDIDWEDEFQQIVLDLISDKVPSNFTETNSYECNSVKALVGLIPWWEDLQWSSPEIQIADVDRRIEAFKGFTRNEQAEILHRSICEGLNIDLLNLSWRKEWWSMIQSWIDAGYLRQPLWMTRLRTYTIV